MPELLLLIDNDESQASIKERVLRDELHYKTIVCGGNLSAIEKLLALKPDIDAALIDVESLKVNALDIVTGLKRIKPGLPVVAFTSYAADGASEQLVKTGVYDVLNKPVSMDRLRLTLQQVTRLKRMGKYIGWLERKIAGHVDMNDLVGKDPAFRQALSQAMSASAASTPLWIEGEPGTGKEMLARAIHGQGQRAGKPFVVVHCDLLPEHMAEAVIFGQHQRNAPAGLHFMLGKLREADQGTLMLKEVTALKPQLQRRLETLFGHSSPGERRIAGDNTDVRLICTSSRKTQLDIEPRMFQQLQQSAIHLSPLRQRRDDIRMLAEHFLVIYAASENKYITHISEPAMQVLCSGEWLGNVAELSKLIWRAVVFTQGSVIEAGDIQLAEHARTAYSALNASSSGDMTSALLDEHGKVRTLKSVEKEAIRFALQKSNGCMAKAAKSLGIGRSTLYRKVDEFNIEGYISRANQTMRPMMKVASTDRS